MKIVWDLPIKTVCESSGEHWTVKRIRHKQQQFFIRAIFAREAYPIELPCTVTMIRLSSRKLDSDNLISAFKYIRDEIAECLFPDKKLYAVKKNGTIFQMKGFTDSSPDITWVYAQEKSKKIGIRIEIEC
jgi:hypothetical protein